MIKEEIEKPPTIHEESQYVIQTKSLSFQYSNAKKVLNNVSINVPKGSIYGFLGPNGAGKTTTIGLLTGIIPEQGKAIQLVD